jgi:2-(1,2-epoxy-1,2-dihydrophenyl)acetyl-CoA isomerase
MSSILFHIEEGIATITLNRPEKLNSFNREMALAMQHRLDECYSLHEVRCVVIRGAGKGFSAGQDLAEVTDPEGPGMARILSEHYNPIIKKIRFLPKPVIAAVNGVAAGAGANIALACDIVIASSHASFIQAFSKIGLIPDSGGTYILPRLIGWQKALALAILGDKIHAEEAEKMGMIYKMVSHDDFTKYIRDLAETVAAMPTKGLGYTKHAFNASMHNGLEEQLIIEDELQQKAASTYDFSEGVKAFMEKRNPTFKGE